MRAAVAMGIDEDDPLSKLTLRDDWTQPIAPEGHSLVYQEYEVGDFECQFTLSGEFDADRIEASLTNGVLSLMIPRAPEAQARTIQIKAGS